MAVCPVCSTEYVKKHGGQEICEEKSCKVARRKEKFKIWYSQHKIERKAYMKKYRGLI